MSKYIKMLRNKNFSLLFWGQGVSEIGSFINYIGLTWLVLNATGEILKLSMLLIFLKLPSIIIGPLAGVWVDRWNKKMIIISSDIIRGILSILLVFTGNINIIYLIVLTQGIFDVFFSPAIRSLVPKLVNKEDLMTANSMTTSVNQLATLIGPAIGGVLVGLFGTYIVFIVNGISFLISALFEMFITIPKEEKSECIKSNSFKEDLVEGFNYISKSKLISFIIIFFAIASLPFGAIPILNIAHIQSLGFSPETYGFITAVFSLGLLSGALLIGALDNKLNEVTMIVLGIGGFGISYISFAMLNYLLLMIAFVFICGIFLSMVNIAYGVYLQKNVEASKLGRVFSIDMAIGNIILLLSMVFTGLLADKVGAYILMIGCGILMLIQVLFTLNFKTYKELTDKEITTASRVI
ncbi:MFS transporter [Alkaliphilus peptidifermentans]|uniref:Predicted arabinose efflux permease, MFS family n=1 Tax=Alkaliphilus peptidifermentans DSM 18978 TaxID=1120976 RepID=A0A1G5KHE9_9FIRM|nr:MFS transporter [Alkaliphilus peptidifermentans]SCY99997.1 Predicted arabinose efflux permease, MFS family [Alkaliphilus peptidifermentans DSM 18978]